MAQLLTLFIVVCGLSSLVQGKAPNIVFIMADDLGWNDIGYHNADIKSPVLDKLASEGIKFSNAYAQPVCGPSRHALMTGIYPYRAGLQNGIVHDQNPVCSPLNMTFFPKKLQALGYSTHMVGKWHLGFCNVNCTPTYRGFDSFLGYYSGSEDYYTKRRAHGIDFRDGLTPASDDHYSTFTYTKRATDIINQHDVNKPLYLYVSFQNVHEPLEVPPQYAKMYPNLNTEGRRNFSGSVTVMDEAVGNITQALGNRGLMDNTVIIFTSDNGGDPHYHGNNLPLRGAKATLFEGGTRVVSFIHGAELNRTGYEYDGMMHIVDWHPTILEIAGGSADAGIDGINLWEEIKTGKPSKRTEFVYNLDDSANPTTGAIAIRSGDFKLIVGNPGRSNRWFHPDVQLHGGPGHIVGKRTSFVGEGLYNLKTDPTEHHDVSYQYPDKVKELKARLDVYRRNYVPPNKPPGDPASAPRHFGGYWSPGWC